MTSIFSESENFDFSLNDDLQEFFENSQSKKFSKNSFVSPENIAQKTKSENIISNEQKKSRKNVTWSQSDLEIKKKQHFSSLHSLILAMKTSFLPREENENCIRQIIFSDTKNPFVLLRKGEDTVILGTGFSEIESAGKKYKTLPDLRLAFSEKSRIRWWILTDENIDTECVVEILQLLDFPVIYGTRAVISHFRENISDSFLLDKIRFFEIFADTMTSRKIGSIDFFISANHLAFLSENSSFSYDFFPISGISEMLAKNTISIQNSTINIAEKSFDFGDIVALDSENISKKSMKFTFDVFFMDEKSTGTVAGYVLPDRKNLSESGVLVFTLEEDIRARTIAGHIFIDSRGFVHNHETMRVHKEIIKWIRMIYENIITENPEIERATLIQIMKKEVQKLSFVLTGRTPIVMPIILEKKSGI